MSIRAVLAAAVWVTSMFGLFPDLSGEYWRGQSIDLRGIAGLYAAFILFSAPVAWMAAVKRVRGSYPDILVGLSSMIGLGSWVALWFWAVISAAFDGGGFVESLLRGLHALCVTVFSIALAWPAFGWLRWFSIPAVVIGVWSFWSVPAFFAGARAIANGASHRVFIWESGRGYVESFHWWEVRGLTLTGPRDGFPLAHHAVLSLDGGERLYYWSKSAMEWHPAWNNQLLDHDRFMEILSTDGG